MPTKGCATQKSKARKNRAQLKSEKDTQKHGELYSEAPTVTLKSDLARECSIELSQLSSSEYERLMVASTLLVNFLLNSALKVSNAPE